MGRAIGLFLAALIAALLVLWLAGPRLMPQPAPAPPATLSPPVSSASTSSTPKIDPGSPSVPSVEAPAGGPDSGTGSGQGLSPPRTAAQQERDKLEAARAPYYAWVRRQAGDAITDVLPADDDGSVLVLYLAQDDPSLVASLVQAVVTPYAYHYGFRHARLFLPNPPGSVERYRFYAEADAESEGVWHTFLK